MPAIRTHTAGTFRFQGRRALLTYSCVGTFDIAYAFAVAVIDHLTPLANDDFKWKWAIEQHHNNNIEEGDLDGSWHVHVAIDLGHPCTERGHVFDFQDNHPNILLKGGRIQWKNACKYLEKDHCWQSNMDDEMDEEVEGETKGEIYRKALESATQEEYQETIAEGDPENFCRSYISIRECGRDRFRQEPKKWIATRTMADFVDVPAAMSDYADYINSDEEIERPRTLIVIGETRWGKTEWARTINANHAHMQGEWNSDLIREDARVLIFDDVPMSELLPKQRWKCFFGMQQEFNITGKYRGAKHVSRGWKAFIYCCNDDPRDAEGVTEATRRYITANSIIVTLDKALY